ncbi:MAG: hypothetical protein J6T02_02095 [Bacteroidales bacterium]|nr:hypothetical protein [Bacteroidales bacterium]
MNEFTPESIISISTNAIRGLMRIHNLPQWPPEELWWFCLMNMWGFPWSRLAKGKPLPVSELNNALYVLDVQEPEIKKPGAHSILELDNIAFVYREKRFKNREPELIVAPHLKGKSFNECDHAFIEVRGSALDLAQYLIGIDRVVPALKTVCHQAYLDGLQEEQIREAELKTSQAFIMEFFKGELPPGVVGYEMADTTPGAVDLIRLFIHDEGTPFWRTRIFDIPYAYKDYLKVEHIQRFIDDYGLQFGSLEIIKNEKTGEITPVVTYRPYVSENEKLGLLDEE